MTPMTDAWSARADAYRTSRTHAEGADLDAVVELCEPAPGVKILDLGTGGGHVARRLRDEGAQVVTVDPAPGMGADVVASAEHLPFADGSFDVVVSRIAAHHFRNLGEAIGEMVRVTNRVLVLEDMLYRTEEEQEAEKLRDPTHVRSLSAEEWRDLLVDAGLAIEQELDFTKEHDMDDWLARTGCRGAEAQRVRELLRPYWTSEDGSSWSNDYIVIKARKSQE
ncbi:MAG TPA: class I SAM-dependent methyltransferase [Gaiellaceae bacterium]|nr:class I SAM-dependent methyltransferase [Gaiellaceae bacterium]